MRTLYLCGVGNGEGIRLALRVNDATARWDRIVLLDDDERTHGTQRLGLAVAGSFDLLSDADRSVDEVVNLVTRTAQGRARARGRIAGFDVPFASLVHPGVDLLGTQLGEEVTVYPMASIGAEARVERSSVVLIGGIVGHGARVGEGCIVAPHAVVNARVRLGAHTYVGSNATILPDVTIGAGATIAANTLVVSDVAPGATALGVPATILSMAGADAEPAPSPLQPPAARYAHAEGADAQLEPALLEIARRLLGAPTVPAQCNFFDAGGTSLKAVQLCERIRAELGLEVALVDVYRHPTVQALARHLTRDGAIDGAVDQARSRAALRRERARH